jgi:hypothetical protein
MFYCSLNRFATRKRIYVSFSVPPVFKPVPPLVKAVGENVCVAVLSNRALKDVVALKPKA